MKITSSHKAYCQFKKHFQFEQEEFWSIALSSNKKILSMKCLFRGTVDACPVHPRDIFRFAIVHNASSFIIAHNHPSGDLKPSLSDLKFTKKLIRLSQTMQIPLIDHLILTKSSYCSFLDNRWAKFSESFERESL